jgi:hypothetical protein
MTTGFIILRTTSEPIWAECHKCIRLLYDNPILILDRDDDTSIQPGTALTATKVLRMNREGGRLLPLFYLYKIMPFDRAVILLDNMLIKKKIDISKDAMLWVDRHDHQETDLETEILSLLGDDELISFYRAGRWACSYMSSYCISLESLTKVMKRVDIFSVLDLMRKDRYRSAMDRVLSCLLQFMGIVDRLPIIGDIHLHENYGHYSIGEYNLKMIPDYPILNIWGLSKDTPREITDTSFQYIPKDHVKMLVEGRERSRDIRRLCLFANYNATSLMHENTITLINELVKYYDRVIVIANDSKVDNILSLDQRVRVVHAPNRTYDFGLWSRVARNLEMESLDELILVNDSCHIISSLGKVMRTVRGSPEGMIGLTDNHDIQYHLQSYFLVFKGHASLLRLREFFLSKDMNRTYDYSNTVREFEVGLTSFMKVVSNITCLYPIDNIYLLRSVGSPMADNELSVNHINSAWMLWDVLLILECPLLKRKRFRSVIKKETLKKLLSKLGEEEYFSSLDM